MKSGDKRTRQGNRAATRTAWVLGAIVLVIYVGALVLGHLGGLSASWEPRQPAGQGSADAGMRVQRIATAPTANATRPSDPSSPH